MTRRCLQLSSFLLLPVLVFAHSAALLVTSAAGAAPGDLDETFGSGGTVITSLGGSVALGLALQPDGKIVAIGSLLVRYNVDGSLDQSFGTDGKVTTASGNALALQPDGKIVTLGSVLARYNVDGSIDESFGTDGKVTTDSARGLALQSDGKIVIVGGRFMVTRYNANGSLDGSFGTGGTVTTVFGASDYSFAVVVQPDGKIVVAGGTENDGTKVDFALARYDTDGSLDQSFGSDGKVTTNVGPTDFGLSDAYASAVMLQPDGKIVAVGVKQDYGENILVTYFALARYSASGSLDPSFGVGGIVSTDFGPPTVAYSQPYATALQSDGKILAGGITGVYGRDDIETGTFVVARYNTNGELDANFGTDGKVTVDPPRGSGRCMAHAVVVQPDGKLVAAGECSFQFALFRYNPDGSLDQSFGSGGKVKTSFGAVYSPAVALVLQPDGKIIAAGTRGHDAFALARYNPDGSLDFPLVPRGTSSFGAGTAASAVALQPDGKIVVAGHTATAFALARYNANGTPDASFGTEGKVTTMILDYSAANGVAVQSDGKIVAVGSAESSYGVSFALARYNQDGSLDGSFGIGGKVTSLTGYDVAAAVALQPDGKIVAAGRAVFGAFALARYNTDGSLDQSFGAGGKVRTSFGADDYANALALQPDGKIVAVGGGNFAFALARYNADGSLDVTFGTDGKVTTTIGTHASASAVALQPDGKIVAAGVTVDYDVNPSVALARYHATATVVSTTSTTSTTLPVLCSPERCQDDDRCTDDFCNSLGQCEHQEQPPTEVAGVICSIENMRDTLAGALCTGHCERSLGRRFGYVERVLGGARTAHGRRGCHKARTALHLAEALASRARALDNKGRFLSAEHATRLVAEAARVVERTGVLVGVLCSGG